MTATTSAQSGRPSSRDAEPAPVTDVRRAEEPVRVLADHSSCAPGGAAHHSASRPSPWWSSRNITNVFFSRTKNDGAPWLSRSVTSGRARQAARTRSNGVSAVPSCALRRRDPEERHDAILALGLADHLGVLDRHPGRLDRGQRRLGADAAEGHRDTEPLG